MKTSNKHLTMARGLENISSIRSGSLLEEFAAAVSEVTEAVKKTRKKGSITVTINVEPADKKADSVDRVWIEDAVVTKLPPSPKKNTLLFIDPEGGLVATDPEQTFIGSARSLPSAPDEKARTVTNENKEARSVA